jgi:4-diphosphocytidyl-2-C-methyl-D-erythritol kinase
MIQAKAPAKVNLALRIRSQTTGRLHELCSVFASLDLCDDVFVEPSHDNRDSISCEGVDQANIATVALSVFREAYPQLPGLFVSIHKHIPIASGLGGGSADAAAVLRAANELSGLPFDTPALRCMAMRVGSDVPAQIVPRHCLVSGTGEVVEELSVCDMPLVLVVAEQGLSTQNVYQQADLIGCTRADLDLDGLRGVRWSSIETVCEGLENDLQPAALALRPELSDTLARLLAGGALGAQITGSGPTAFGIFESSQAARACAAEIDGAFVVSVRE